MQRAAESLADAQRQVSTGRRVGRLSDDPLSAAACGRRAFGARSARCLQGRRRCRVLSSRSGRQRHDRHRQSADVGADDRAGGSRIEKTQGAARCRSERAAGDSRRAHERHQHAIPGRVSVQRIECHRRAVRHLRRNGLRLSGRHRYEPDRHRNRPVGGEHVRRRRRFFRGRFDARARRADQSGGGRLGGRSGRHGCRHSGAQSCIRPGDYGAGAHRQRSAQSRRHAVADFVGSGRVGDSTVDRSKTRISPQAASQLSQAETAYRAALSAMATIGRVSLMDYLK